MAATNAMGRLFGLALLGLAMWKGAAKPQTQRAKPAQGRADLRALKRSARRRREAPK